MPEHPPCLTPILKHKSSLRSDLILFKCFNALSVSDIAGAILSDAGAAETSCKLDKDFERESLNNNNTKKIAPRPKVFFQLKFSNYSPCIILTKLTTFFINKKQGDKIYIITEWLKPTDEIDGGAAI